jgi:hypothetical protein
MKPSENSYTQVPLSRRDEAEGDPPSDESLSDSEKEELFHDYEQANEEARYRDRLIYNSYYLSVIVFFFISQSILTAIVNDEYFLLPIIFFSGSFIYILLTGWALSVIDSRNSAWSRLNDIEEQIDSLESNQYTSLVKGPIKRDTADNFKQIAYRFTTIRSISDIPDFLKYANPDLLNWFLLPIAILLFLLGVVSSLQLQFDITTVIVGAMQNLK